jgi:hypothetical protein
MNAPDPKPDKELTDLLEAWSNDEIDEEHGRRLQERLTNDPLARQAYLSAVAFEAMVEEEFPAIGQKPIFVTAPRRISLHVWLAAVAALFVILTGLFFVMLPGKTGTAAQGQPSAYGSAAGPLSPQFPAYPEAQTLARLPVARITHITGVDDIGGTAPFEVGQIIKAGELSLSSGQIDIESFSGVKLRLEAPAKLSLRTDFHAFLGYGTLVVDGPSEGVGFTVYTPTSLVRDIGTVFAVKVDEHGDTSFRVVDGEIEAGSNSAANLSRFHTAEGRRVINGQLLAMDDDMLLDDIELPRRSDEPLPRSIHWSFDEVAPDGIFLDRSEAMPLRVTRSSPTAPASTGPIVVPGVHGHALRFDGGNRIAISEYRGIAGNAPRTIAFWVRLPTDGNMERPNGIVSWGVPRQSGKWQISWNTSPLDGMPGAVRVEFGGGYIIGNTNLCDGRWHHVSVVNLGGDSSPAFTHIKIYINGRLDVQSGRRNQIVRTNITADDAMPVTLGRYIGPWRNPETFHLEADIDEVHIFEEALTPGQIARLAAPPEDK